MKKLYFGLILVLTSFTLNAQNVTIKGIVEDTLGNALIGSTVLLMEASDSTMVKFSRTALDGSFIFKKVQTGNYIVKTTYTGYIPKTVSVPSNTKKVDLGKIRMKELSEELMAVVIKAAKAPIKMRGDTIEYDASTFKVPEGSSVEELLKQLPGLEIEQDGSIQADGKNVDRVTVDGKKFFGSDPKAATKNLPAEGISKVQVFDTKTEAAKATGSNIPSDSKTLNLELKDGYKKGMFGRVTAGIGTEDRAELKGNFNRFNDKIQFSLVGVGNNTGRNGLGWDDYQDFMGSSSFSFNDDGAYGFGGGGGMYRIVFGGSNSSGLESSIQSAFFGGSNGGFPENYNGGVNLNYDHKKTKVSSVYYYNNASLLQESKVRQKRFFTDFTTESNNQNKNNDKSEGHRVELSWDQEIDSLHSFKIEMNGAYIDQNKLNIRTANLARNGTAVSKTNFDNSLNSKGHLLNGIAYFRKKFQRKGRRFGANVSYLTTELDNTGNQVSNSTFLRQVKDSTSLIKQLTLNNGLKHHYKANAIYVEPIAKHYFWHTFYNFSQRFEGGDRNVYDQEENNALVGNLSRKYQNDIGQHRLGTMVRYNKNGLTLSAGVAAQRYIIKGNYQTKDANPIKGDVNKTFDNIIPYVGFNMSPSRNGYLDMSYSFNTSEPNISDLQPIVDNTNPFYIREGNPALTPELSHTVRASFRKSMPLSGMRFYSNINFNYNQNSIINRETVDKNLVTYVNRENYEGGNRASMYASFTMPIVRRKLKMTIGSNISMRNSFAYVNDYLNKTNTWNYSPNVRLSFTPTKLTSISANGRWNISNTKYEINTTQNQQNYRYTYGLKANSKLFWNMYVNSSLDYTQIINKRFNINQSVPILNASLYKQFLEGNKMEIRVSVYDALNKNRRISQNAFGNSYIENETLNLGRYVMLSVSYNIKGLKSGIKRNRWF